MKQRLTLTLTRQWRRLFVAVLATVLTAAPFVGLGGTASAAACTLPNPNYGTASTNVSLPANATYRVWTRINVPDTANNTYLLEIDGNKCYTVGGGSYTANSWVWIAHQNGTTSSKIDVALTQGNHTVKLIGNKPNVKIDRLVFVSDLNCTPSGNGDNCNQPADTTAPVARITSPTANAGVSGTIPITVNATDASGVKKVEMFINSAALGTDTTTPYAFQWDTTKLPNGSHLLTVKAYDAAGNVGTDSFRVTVENGDKTAPSIPSDLAARATSYNAVTISWKASTDNIGVKGYTLFRDGVPIADTGNVTSYNDTGLSANTTYSYKILAFDANGNKSAVSGSVSVKTQNVADSVAPTMPTNLAATANGTSQIDIKWTPSTDNIGVTKYEIYRALDGDTDLVGTTTTTSFGDTNLRANTTYSYYVVAKDASNNESAPSATVSAKTNAAATVTKKRTIRGVITDQSSDRRIPYAAVTYNSNGKKHISQANSRGRYALQRLESGRYNLTFKAEKYYSKTTSVRLGDVHIVKDINLQKRKR